MRRAFLISFIITFLGCIYFINADSKQSNIFKKTLIHNEIKREYILYVPNDLPLNAPLVLVAHGYTSSAETIMSYSGMNKVAEKEKFLVVYPQGTVDSRNNNFFNVGYDFHKDSKIDDLGFIKSLVKNLITEYKINSEQVFATGMSNGGDLSYYLACNASEIFKAVAPIAGSMMQKTITNCNPKNPMPIFEIHGKADDITLFNGDMENIDGWGPYPSIPNVIDFWVNKNGLELYNKYDFTDINKTDKSFITFHKYWSNNSNIEVWFYVIHNGGHNWPLLKSPYSFWKDPMSWLYFRGGNKDIDTSTEVWNFFKRYSN